MPRALSILIALAIGIGLLSVAVNAVTRSAPHRRRRRTVGTLAAILIAIGAIGFIGSSISATGGLNWLPTSFEWPVGSASGVITLPDGTLVVPHTPVGRVQVYTADAHFIRGWNVDSSGGTFKLLPAGPDRFDVITVRGRQRLTYTVAGQLVGRSTYEPADYSSFPNHGHDRRIPTSLLLYVFSHPAISWAVGASGMFLLILLDRKSYRRGGLRLRPEPHRTPRA